MVRTGCVRAGLVRWLALAASLSGVTHCAVLGPRVARVAPLRALASAERARAIRALLPTWNGGGGDGGSGVSDKALRFGAMLERCRGYSKAEIAALQSQPRQQQLLTGVIAGARNAEVVAAFTVLYEDFLPLRLGGDLIFKILDDKLRAAVAAQAAAPPPPSPTSACDDAPVMSAPQLASAKALFQLIDEDGSGLLTVDEVIGSGFLQLLRQYYGAAEIDELFQSRRADSDGGGQSDGGGGDGGGGQSGAGKRGAQAELSFEQFVRAASAIGALPDAEALRLELLRNRAVVAAGGGAAAPDATRPVRERTAGDRYDEMLRTFAEWAQGDDEARLLASVDSPRLRSVLAGCFAGAREAAVVRALRTLYEDHAPLRLGGDLIFGLMKRVVARARAS